MAGVVEDNGHVNALAGETGSRAARQNGGSRRAAGGQCGFNIRRVAGKDNADWKLAVVGGVGRVKRARAKIEANLAVERFLQ